MLRYAAGRYQLQSTVHTLLSTASVVYLEDLDYAGMTSHFSNASRELGLRDFLLAWLPQRLAATGIEKQWVAPIRTSQVCSLTHMLGSRDDNDATKFTDGHGQVVDADLNAARVIMQIGLAYRLIGGGALPSTRNS